MKKNTHATDKIPHGNKHNHQKKNDEDESDSENFSKNANYINDSNENYPIKKNRIKNKYWKELFEFMSSIGVLLVSFGILLYLLSYSQSECPLKQ